MYNVQWNIGLNPYSVYEECYGGAPDPRGVIRETATEIEVMVPELALRMDSEQLETFEKVSLKQQTVSFKHFKTFIIQSLCMWVHLIGSV